MNNPDLEYADYNEEGNNLIKNTDFDARLGFVRKVYSIISAQLLFTAIFSAWAMASVGGGLGYFMLTNSWMLWVMLAVNIVTMLMVFCCRSMAVNVPINYILLGLFTFSESWIVGSTCAIYSASGLGRLVLMAAIATAGMTLALTLYAFTTKTDMTIHGGALFIVGCVVSLFVFFSIFTDNKIFHIILSLVVVVLYSFYLIYDTQLIMGGKTYELSIDDYIIGAIIIYIDIIVLFLRILELLSLFFGNSNDN